MEKSTITGSFAANSCSAAFSSRPNPIPRLSRSSTISTDLIASSGSRACSRSAFTIPRARQIHLVRDRLGKKPLYYGEIEGAFCFASELKAILAGAASRPEIEPQAIYDFLTLRYVPGPATIWRGLRSLEAGTCLTLNLDDRKLAQRKFWSVEFRSETFDPGRDYAAEFEQLLRAATEKRLVASDVPVGILLSGGIDSSAIAATAAELGHNNLHSFSVAFDEGGDSDETPFARLVARHLGTQHSEVMIGQKEFLEFLPRFVTATDEPLADLASIPLYFVSALAKRMSRSSCRERAPTRCSRAMIWKSWRGSSTE